MRATTLQLRLARGGGWTEAGRALLLAVGSAVGLLCVLTALSVPSAIHDRNDRATTRIVQVDRSEGDHRYRAAAVDDVHEQHVWRRVTLSAPGPGDPLPPGVTAIPPVGDSLVSPRLWAQRDDPLVRPRLGNVVGVIAEPGLQGPTDLISYTTVQDDAVADGDAVAGWGDPSQTSSSLSTGTVDAELAVLVGLPLLLFSAAVSRLGSESRSRRLTSLRVLGTPALTLARAMFLETAAPALAGGLLGGAVYNLSNQLLASSGVFGFTWFAGASSLSPPTTVASAAALGLVLGLLASRGLRRRLEETPARGRRLRAAAPNYVRLVPLMLGVSMLIVFGLVIGDGTTRAEPAGLTVLAAVLACGGLLWSASGIAVAAGQALLTRRPSTGLLLGVRRLQYDASSVVRSAVSVVSLVLVAGLSQDVLQAVYESSGVTRAAAVLEVDGRDATTAGRNALSALTARTSTSAEYSEVDEALAQKGIPYITVYFMSCAAFRAAAAEALPDCTDGNDYRLASPVERDAEAVPSGLTFTVAATPLVTPTPVLLLQHIRPNLLLHDNSVLVARTEPHTGWSPLSIFTYDVAAAHIEQTRTAIATASPTSLVNVTGQNLAALDVYKVHRGAIDLGVLVGLGLGVTALIVGVLDRAYERRRAVARLVAVGVPSRTVRSAQACQIALILGTGAGLAVPLAALAGNRYLAIGGYTGATRQAFWWALTTALVASAATLAASTIVYGRDLRSDDLRGE